MTKNALKGPGPIIECNRLPRGSNDYEKLFRENFAGSQRLTFAMIDELGWQKVADPTDVKCDVMHDVTDIVVYEIWKNDAKPRKVYYNAYAPRCSSFSFSQRKCMERSSGVPYGIGVRDAVTHDNVMWLRAIALCEIHHAVGDAFSTEHIFPTLALEFEETKELMGLPGVFLITFDNCVYG
jgi:hypothetical protein